MLKYSVEGEKNLPFNLKEIDVISTASGVPEKNEENIWQTDIYQNNDIYFYLEKNAKYGKEEIIKNIIFNNFVFTKTSSIGSQTIYRPSDDDTYSYTEEYLAGNELIYVGGQDTDVKSMQINNQGGLIGFSIATNNIGKYTFSENEKIIVDGSLLNKININQEDIQFEISFDIIIETGTGKKFKSNIKLSLPEGNTLEEGVHIEKYNDQKKFVFKRM